MQQKVIYVFENSNTALKDSLDLLQKCFSNFQTENQGIELELSQGEIEQIIKDTLIALATIANISNTSLSELVNEILYTQGV